MLEERQVAVVVPAHDEEAADRGRRSPGFPRSSTASTSSTTPRATRPPSARAARATRASRSLAHEKNRGVGAAIVTGYKRALADGVDVVCGDGGRQPDGPGRPRAARRAGRARRARLREGEPALHRQGLGPDSAHALPRQRGALDADEDRVRLLARRRLAVGLHGDLEGDARRTSTSTASTPATASRTTCSCT